MNLDSKLYVLTDEKGEAAKISDIKNLKILLNGEDFNLYVIPREKNEPVFFYKASLEDNILEGFSIFEKFNQENGMLVHDDVHIAFYDEETKTPLLVKIEEPSFLGGSAFYETLTDAQVAEQLETLKELIGGTETEVTDTKAEEKTAEETVEVPLQDDKSAETPVPEQSIKQIEEGKIPDEIMAQYEVYKNGGMLGDEEIVGLIPDGYKEYAYKNYRFFLLPDSQGQDAMLLILTPAGILTPDKDSFEFFPPFEGETECMYRFKMNGEQKALYYDTEKDNIVVKKVKKKDIKKNDEPAAEVKEEKKEEKPAEVK